MFVSGPFQPIERLRVIAQSVLNQRDVQTDVGAVAMEVHKLPEYLLRVIRPAHPGVGKPKQTLCSRQLIPAAQFQDRLGKFALLQENAPKMLMGAGETGIERELFLQCLNGEIFFAGLKQTECDMSIECRRQGINFLRPLELGQCLVKAPLLLQDSSEVLMS